MQVQEQCLVHRGCSELEEEGQGSGVWRVNAWILRPMGSQLCCPASCVTWPNPFITCASVSLSAKWGASLNPSRGMTVRIQQRKVSEPWTAGGLARSTEASKQREQHGQRLSSEPMELWAAKAGRRVLPG